MARVSTPANQHSDSTGLINYLIKNKHWSPFEMVSMCLEIETSRAISAQILRHRSFHFQEFSQRYSEVQEFIPIQARKQSEKNRQSSTNDLDPGISEWFYNMQARLNSDALAVYNKAIKYGIAKESARFLLPISAKTRLYVHGTVRDWIHYINLRTEEGVQAEHRWIAQRCRDIFVEEFPLVSKSLGWIE